MLGEPRLAPGEVQLPTGVYVTSSALAAAQETAQAALDAARASANLAALQLAQLTGSSPAPFPTVTYGATDFRLAPPGLVQPSSSSSGPARAPTGAYTGTGYGVIRSPDPHMAGWYVGFMSNDGVIAWEPCDAHAPNAVWKAGGGGWNL